MIDQYLHSQGVLSDLTRSVWVTSTHSVKLNDHYSHGQDE